jgi:DNA (cytosine-5)-methyltransferase 1
MNVLDLFSGIGGFSLGLERAGMRTVAFCEIDPYCRAVLAKHWPSVPCYFDVRSLTAERLHADGIAADVICGGFPCQDVSLAGKGAGIDGERSGLWSEYARIIGEVRPRYVIVENVAALLHRGLDRVLGDLAALGYDAEWHCIPASALGAPHYRDRVWIIADAAGGRLAIRRGILTRGQIADAATEAFGQWDDMPDVGRALHGLPHRVDRLRSLGNAVVPQIPEIIGRAIMRAE